jgi:signal peptidase I
MYERRIEMPEEEKINIGKEILEWIIYFVAAALVASFLQSQLYALTTVHQSSMQNTFFEGHTLIMNKLSYQYSEPKAGDIIIFLKGENTKGFLNKYKVFFRDIELRFNNSFRTNRLIKRVIAVGGDKVDIHDGQVFINDQLIDEPYVKGITPAWEVEYPLIVPEDCVFVMGDNRENSQDSRSFGPIHIDSIEGKAIFRVYPFSQVGKP